MTLVAATNARTGIDPTDAVLVDPVWLAAHLRDPGVRVVEVDVNPNAFNDGHIEGAVLWNIYRDLKTPEYQLVGPATIHELFTTSGIAADSTVVFYGYAPAFGFWLMKLFRHADVRILDCSRESWRDAGGQWSDQAPNQLASEYTLPAAQEAIRASRSAARAAIVDPATTILDVRTLAEFRGDQFWPSGALEPGGRAGHIPSAVHLPIEHIFVDERGAFRTHDELALAFDQARLAGDAELITYCTIGARACTAWFVLTYLLGRDHVRVYDGSWAEWGRAAESPVESS